MSREFSFIKPFRALAAFWVLSGHALQWWEASHPTFIPAAKMAVDLFMVISGYLMAANAFARDSFEPLSQPRNWLRFWIRRYFRVAPAYYLSLALAVLLSGPFLGGYQYLVHMAYGNAVAGTAYDPSTVQYTPFNILLHLSFLFGLFPAYTFSTYLPDWSLSLEMQFYFVFPLLFVILRRFDFAKPAALIGFTTFVLGLFFSRHVHFNEPSLLLLKLNYFIAGIVLHRFLSGDLNKVQGAATGLLAVALVSVDYRYGLGLLILPVLLTLMLVLGRLELEGKTPKWLSALIESRVVQFASDTSYSVYLFHGFFIAAAGYIVAGHESFINAQPRLSSWLMYGFVLVFTYVAANAAYRFVELPSIRLGKRVIERTLPRARADSGTPRGPEASSSTQAAKS